MRTLLANARGSTGVPTGTKSFFIDEFDDRVVRRILGEVDKARVKHG